MKVDCEYKSINTGQPLIDNLYNAVRDYVEADDGSILVIGGIQVQDHQNGNFYLAVKCTGVVPEFARVKNEQENQTVARS